jgi:hypothetical protein
LLFRLPGLFIGLFRKLETGLRKIKKPRCAVTGLSASPAKWQKP